MVGTFFKRLRRRRRYVQLQIKVTVIIFTILTGIALGIGHYLGQRVEERGMALARTYLTTLPSLVDRSIEDFMVEGQKDTVRQIVANLAADEHIVGIHIFNTFGDISCEFDELNEGYSAEYMDAVGDAISYKETMKEISVDDRKFIAYYKPYENKPECQPCHMDAGRFVGILNINLDVTHLQEEMRADAVNVQSVLIANSIIMTIILSALLNILVIAPLGKLEHGMAEVARNNLDVRVKIRSHDEFERISRFFNYMVVSLRRAFRTINEMHRRMVHNDRLMTVGSLTASISHEIKNPLNSIVITADILDAKAPEYRQYIDKIIIDAEKIRDIIDQTLNFSKLSGSKAEKVGLVGFLEGIQLYAKKILFDRSSVEFSVARDDVLPAVWFNRVHLEQVIVNLLKNAVEAVESTGGGRVRLVVRGLDDVVEFIVEDNGPGIPEDVRSRIFDEYFTTKSSGTGLGLSIVKELVESYDGTILLKSESGVGTVFTIRLPAVSDASPDGE